MFLFVISEYYHHVLILQWDTWEHRSTGSYSIRCYVLFMLTVNQ